MTTTVSAAAASPTAHIQDPRPTATTPTACPPWCALGPITSDAHRGGNQAIAHRSTEVVLSGPADECGQPILARAELFRLDEAGEGAIPAVLYAQGETDAQYSTPSQIDALIASAEAFTASLRAMRAQLALDELLTEHSARVVEVDADDLPELRGRSFADVNGLPVLVFPYGQDPRERLTLARQFLARHTA